MKKFRVILSTTYSVWDDVEAKNEAEAIGKCKYPPEFDSNDEHHWNAVEIDEED